MSNIIVDLEKGENDVHHIILDRNIEIGIITVNKYNDKNLLCVFSVLITDKRNRGKGYFPKAVKYLEDYGKNNGFKYIILNWIKLKYVDSWKKRGFRLVTPQEYNFFPIQKGDEKVMDAGVIKPL